jgi:hypothetical protein
VSPKIRKWIITLAALASLCAPSHALSWHPRAPALDRFGGVVAAPCRGGATGYFRLETARGRWIFCTPLGHAFWMLSVYQIDWTTGGAAYATAVQNKYGSSQAWAAQATARLESWGFNTVGPQSGEGSHNVFPVSTYNAAPNPHPMPFLRYIDLSSWCVRNASYQVKNLYNGMNPAVFSVARTFPDVFDPNWVACAQYYAANGDGSFTPNLPRNEPWMIGTWLGDADFLYGFGRGPQTPGGAHPHLGWIAATMSPTQSSGPNGDFSNLFTYSNQTVYTKLAWQSYLENKYGTIQALNAAWGSNYTTFGSSGGWPKSTTGGAGLMDEDGSSPWMGNGAAGLVGTNANAAADLNEFLGQIATQYFRVASQALKTAYPTHLVFGPGSLNAQTYPQVLEAAGKYLDVVEVWVEPKYVARLKEAWDIAHRPLVIWTTLTSQEDSLANKGKPWGGACTGNYDFCTQRQRGLGYSALISKYWNAQTPQGTHFVVGLDWWAWADQVTNGENMNFGLVNLHDQAYDGHEATSRAVRPRRGIRLSGLSVAPRALARQSGPAAENGAASGDFLDSVIRANREILRRLIAASRATMSTVVRRSDPRLPAVALAKAGGRPQRGIRLSGLSVAPRAELVPARRERGTGLCGSERNLSRHSRELRHKNPPARRALAPEAGFRFERSAGLQPGTVLLVGRSFWRDTVSAAPQPAQNHRGFSR